MVKKFEIEKSRNDSLESRTIKMTMCEESEEKGTHLIRHIIKMYLNGYQKSAVHNFKID